jgi:hypothetical protein
MIVQPNSAPTKAQRIALRTWLIVQPNYN